MVELQKLCDKVPSYPSEIAFQTITDELGRSPDELFSDITPEPVAAASLGQVYKATLRATGEVVAVKVSRYKKSFSLATIELLTSFLLDSKTEGIGNCFIGSLFGARAGYVCAELPSIDATP
jgi:ABC1 atypical kinase-like domain